MVKKREKDIERSEKTEKVREIMRKEGKVDRKTQR